MAQFFISHDRDPYESMEAKAEWFQSLTLEERMDIFCFFTELIIENNPEVLEMKNAELPQRNFRIVKKA